jgi:hypothetical protein
MADRDECFKKHRERVRQTYSARALKNFVEGRILRWLKNSPNHQDKKTKDNNEG